MITVEHGSAVPPFEQIRSQIASQINDGDLVAGAKLPTVRQLAEDLGVAVNTAARAYQELTAAGLIETRGRGGTRVLAAAGSSEAAVQEAAGDFAAVARQLGVPAVTAVEMVRAALADRTAPLTLPRHDSAQGVRTRS